MFQEKNKRQEASILRRSPGGNCIKLYRIVKIYLGSRVTSIFIGPLSSRRPVWAYVGKLSRCSLCITRYFYCTFLLSSLAIHFQRFKYKFSHTENRILWRFFSVVASFNFARMIATGVRMGVLYSKGPLPKPSGITVVLLCFYFYRAFQTFEKVDVEIQFLVNIDEKGPNSLLTT